MKAFFVLTILFALGMSTFTTKTPCTCTQLLSQVDCIKQLALGCAWDSAKSACSKDTSTSVTPTTTYATYCEQFNQTDCPTKSGCQWLTTKCSHFTGCTAFAKTTDADCQAISNKCITDGVHCVEKSTCSSYMKQLPCVVSASGSLCYWDASATPNVCVDATKCEQLPVTFLTDADCRAKIPTCTAKTGGGCQDSGANCADQTTQLQCFWNKLQSQSCFWNGTACVDRTCANALTTYTTDDACKTYLPSCTTKSGGGCVIRAACSAATNQESCKTNSSGGLCYWNSANACVDKNCGAAPTTYTTNKQCSDFVTGCITKKDGGCKSNGACSVADVATACSTNSSGGLCIWSSTNTCLDKTCTNAPSTNTTHDLCTAFMPSCTVNTTNNGCRIRTCDNATTDYDSNDKCNTYLTGCITKTGGGCVVNTTCSAITLDKACLKDANGNACIFDSTCKDKTCANAPTINNTHALCQAYMNTCTVNSAANGCIDMTCENIQSPDNCSKDKSSNVCVWKGTCYKKQCKQAASTITAYSDCTNFMASCTVDNDGSGCMDKPPQCSGILTQAGCVVNSSGGVCAWSSNKCQDQTCATAPSTTGTTSDCNTYRAGCIVNNNKNGCIDPTTTACNARTLEDNCNASAGPVCLWDPTTPSCIAKSCATASQTSITTANGYVTGGYSNSSCGTYLTGCIVNNDSTGCIAKGTSCSSYSSTNCTQGLANGGACYWNTADSTCVDKQCQLIKKTTHSDCKQALATCTYGNGTVCAAQQASCGGYTQNQCYITSGGKTCIWANNACRDATCTDATNTADFNSHAECQTLGSTCTMVDRVDNTGCVSLSTNCSDYTLKAQCNLDAAGNACFWNYNQCILASAKTCAILRMATYSTSDCSDVLASCKENADQTGCIDKQCSDYSSSCSTYIANCISNRTNAGCITKAQTCAAAADASCTVAEDGQCTWADGHCALAGAAPKTCAGKTGTDLKYSDCQTYLATCSVKLNGSGCINEENLCSGYSDQANCRKATVAYCQWDATGGGSCNAVDNPIDCTKIIGAAGLITYTTCSDISSTCYANSDGTACKTKGACSTYAEGDCLHGENDTQCHWNGTACYILQNTCTGYTQANCLLTTNSVKCYWDGTNSACIQISTASTDCVKVIADSGLTHNLCQAYNQGCTGNVAGSQCIEYKAVCAGLTQANCSQSQAGKCFWYSNSCISIASASDCAKVTGSGLTQDNCQAYNTACAKNTSGSACEAKSCTNKPAAPFTDSACSAYVSTCTSNSLSNATACLSAPASCSGFTTSDTCIRATEGACVWVAGVVANTGNCVKKTCYTATISSDFNDHTKCNAYLSTCTVAKVGGCTNTGACSTYKSQAQCGANSCFWNNRLNYGCVNPSCDQVETAYNTHTLCNGTNLGCTVKANLQGCMALASSCGGYTIQDQCHSIINHATCVWITADSGNTCQQMSCSTADSSHTTHQSCYDYFYDEGATDADMCTVAIVDVGGTPTPKGCQQVATCGSYSNDANCKIDNQGNDCVWNSSSNTCAVKSCATAPATDDYNTNDECRTYMSDHSCTVDTSGSGCMIRPAKCDGMTQAQCVTNYAGGACEWFQEKCVDKACETAPDTATDAAGCNTYLAGCTIDSSIKCKTQICEDFVFTTDSDCQKAKAGCTSNGTNCVARTVCQAAVQAGCVTQSDGKQCQWVTSSSTCVVKACSTAPATTDFATESQCAAYFPGCTTKSGNGCTVKSTCANANVDAACTTASDGTKCVWDTNKCRNIDCQDYSGTTYAECQAKGTNCTAGLNGKCIQLSNCEAVVTRSACVYGLNGPCLWIAKYNNGSGACFAHFSCKSRPWNLDSQCKMISDQCTTNGSNCLAITSCAETNTSGGCKTGYDGNCIQTVASLGSTDPAVCKIYNACSDAFYTTHNDCQNASVKCTTNGTTSCAPLGACSSYTIEEACKINDKAGPTLDTTTGGVTVTGICKWDTTAATPSCRDQVCSDLTGLTHDACYVQLSTCTSDGTNCLTKGACASYKNQSACENGYGSDGPQGECFWEAASTTNNNTANCRIMKCSDIASGTTTAVCQASLSSCVSDGTACIAQDKCSTYKTQTSCNSQGTDGICVFAASTATGAAAGSGTCTLMSQCSTANSDSIACAQAKDRCSWTPSSGTGATAVASKCATHTCASFATTNPTIGCTTFLSWDKATQQVCTAIKGVCTETDPSTLTVDSCYSISGYTYTWSTSTSKCSVCTNVVVNNTNNTNTSNSTTDSGYILGLSSILLGYLMF